MRNSKRLDYLLHSAQLFFNIAIRGKYEFEYDLMPIHSTRMPMAKRINLLKAGANLIYRKSHPWSFPLHMHVELTNYCNLKCKVCPTGCGILNRNSTFLDPVLFERIMDEVGSYLLTMSLWGWGEPLLHPRLADILRLAQNRGITTFLSTNGQNLDDPVVLKALIDFPPTYLIVAIDGLTDETNSRYRVGAKIAPALAGVKRLAQMKQDNGQQFPILNHRFIAMKHNEHEVPRLKQFAIDNHFNMTTIRTLSIMDAQKESDHTALIPSNDNYKAYKYHYDQRVSRSDFTCERAFIFPTFLADGTLVGCDQDYNAHAVYGSLSEGQSFKDVWWSQRAANIRKTIRENMNFFSHCKNCPFKDRPVTDCSIVYLDSSK